MADEFESGTEEASKKRVQEAVWAWTGRAIVLAVVFIFGRYSGYVSWGSGDEGAEQLRPRVAELQLKYDEQRKRVIDCEGRLTVVQGRLDEVQRAVQKAAGAANTN